MLSIQKRLFMLFSINDCHFKLRQVWVLKLTNDKHKYAKARKDSLCGISNRNFIKPFPTAIETEIKIKFDKVVVDTLIKLDGHI